MRNRRIKNIIPTVISCILLVISILYFINHKAVVSTHSMTFSDLFDTVISFNCESTEKDFDKYLNTVQTKYKYYNDLFDQYNEYEGVNNVYTLNKEAYLHPVTVDDDLIECLQIAFEINDLNSNFDVTQGNLLRLWHNYRTEGIELNSQGKDGNLPTDEEIQESLKHFGKDKIKIEGNTITFLDPNVYIDLGGIAKGYATQKVKEELMNQGCERGFINAGGNIVLIGQKSDGNPWKVGIQNPETGSSIIAYVTYEDKTLVTSGDYQRYYMVGDKRYSHIVNPSTGYPATIMRSVTIICDDSAYADALSTTLFCMSYEDGINLINELKKLVTIDAVWIFDSNGNGDIEKEQFSIYYTDGLKDKLQY